jgi:hypothetical protein
MRLFAYFIVFGLAMILSCKTTKPPSELAIISDWYAFALVADRYTEGFRAPVAARAYAYTSIAAWQATHQLMAAPRKSLTEQWPELKTPAIDGSKVYSMPLVLNACYNTIFEKFFLATPRNIEKARHEVEDKWNDVYRGQVDKEVYERSVHYGRDVALAVYGWAQTDTIAHQGHLHNFDKDFVPPVGDAFWQPCSDFPTPSLLPQWGNCRTFLIKTEDYLAAPHPAFSYDVQSEFYKQSLEIYTLNAPLSEENAWISEFWSDDHPSLTFSSAGRWISILNQVVDVTDLPFDRVLEAYLRTSLAMSDAAVACWYSKYHYNILRPETYIRRTFNTAWRPIIHTPPFPAYPSGHAMVSAAAAEVLGDIYGKDFAMTDNSHKGRTEFKGNPRKFKSFDAMVEENAFSRVALGVHFRMDCDEGTKLGYAIGKRILGMKL